MNLNDIKKFAGEIDPQIPTLDLHTLRVDEIDYLIDQFLVEQINLKNFRVKIITGIGTGFLKNKVREILQKNILVVDILEIDGAFIVIL